MAESDTKLERAEAIVKAYLVAAVVVGLVPLPLIGVAALAAIQLKMLHSLANVYESAFSSQFWGSLVASFVGGGVPEIVGSVVRRSLPLVGVVSTSVFAGASTYAIGKVSIQNHESGGTFLTLDPQAVRDYYTEQFGKGKEEVRKFIGVRP